MKMLKHLTLALTVGFSLNAANEESQAPAYGFGGPEVLKLDWGTRSMNVRDFNGDGLNDIAVVNNDLSKVEILYQLAAEDSDVAQETKKQVSDDRWEPDFEDARYRRESVSVGFPIFDMVVGDLNSDGLADLVYTAREMPVTVRYQSEDGQWNDSDEFDGFEPVGWTDSMVVADLDGDEREDLLLIAADALRVFRQNAEGQLEQPELFYITGENPYNMMVHDVTGDGLMDVLYVTSSGKQSLALRVQLPDGGFGPERRFIFERPVRRISVLPQTDPEAALEFVSIDSRTGILQFFEIQVLDSEARLSDFGKVQPEIYPIVKKGRLPTRYVQTDLNGDGEQDLVASNPSRSELLVFLNEETGFSSARRFPTFSQLSSMASGRFFEGASDSVILVSESEKALGLSLMDERGRMSFPSSIELPADADPIVCASSDLDGDGLDELVLFVETDSDASLLVLQPEDREDLEAVWKVREEVELSDLRRKPNDMKFVDVLGDSGQALMLFVPREAPLVFISDASQPMKLEAFGTDSQIRQSMMKDLTVAQVSTLDVTGDGVKELVVGRRGYARALSFAEDDFEMVDQFNARRGDDEVSAVVPLVENGEINQLMFYIETQGELQLLNRNDDGVFRYTETNAVGGIELIDWFTFSDDAAHSGYIFAGEGGFWRVSLEGQPMELKVTGRYETELEDVLYSHLVASDFAGDGALDLIAVDGQNHVVEILSERSGEWQSRIYWEIFEQNLHYQGRTGGNLEPRQIVVGDFNGNGLGDFAFLVHDRILVYPQE